MVKWLRGYLATRLRSYVATRLHQLKNELDSCVACFFRLKDYCFGTWIKERVIDSCVALLFRLKDYCFGTLIKEQVKFLCSALFSTWKNKHNVQKP